MRSTIENVSTTARSRRQESGSGSESGGREEDVSMLGNEG